MSLELGAMLVVAQTSCLRWRANAVMASIAGGLVERSLNLDNPEVFLCCFVVVFSASELLALQRMAVLICWQVQHKPDMGFMMITDGPSKCSKKLSKLLHEHLHFD